MFKLRYGYFISGIAIGLILLFSFLRSLPDGKLRIVFCNVGQGDAAYVRLPDGRDMLIDGGPNDSVINCLGKYMPFWDRDLDIVLLSHPQADHMQGLLTVFDRYRVGYFLRSDVTNASEGFTKLERLVRDKGIKERFIVAGNRIGIGATALTALWPSANQVARMQPPAPIATAGPGQVLGAQSQGDLNDGSIVLWLRYGSFDAIFPGDADSHVEDNYAGTKLADDTIELLKVPHHGSRTGMTKAFVDWLKPKLAVISVGKNSYGHPTPEAMNLLTSVGSRIMRTDKDGNIEIVSDGRGWNIIK